MSVLQPLSCGQTESKVCLPSHVLISHKVDAPCNLYVKQHVLDTKYHAFTDVPETKKNTHFGSYLEEAAKARERAYIYQASQAQNNLAPVCRLFEEAFVDNLTVPQVRRYCVLCNDAQHIQKLKLTCAMLHARFVEVPRQAEKGKLSMILIAPILWMWFMDQQSLKIASVSMPVDCCHQTGNNKSLGEWQTDQCCLCVHL